MNDFLLSMEWLRDFFLQCHLTLANGITEAVFVVLCCISSAIVTEQTTKAGRKKCASYTLMQVPYFSPN